MSLRPIYYDTETTGIRADRDRIIEIAAFDPVENRTFVSLVNPKSPIPPDATAIHGITDEMVASAPTFEEVGKQFFEFCSGNVVLVAHNNDAFDRHFLVNESKRYGLELPSFPMVDSLKWARRYRSDLPRHSLQFLREVYGFPSNKAHRALDDVIVLHQVFSIMVDDLPWERVLELLAGASPSTHMPFGKHQGKPLKEVPKDYLQWLADNGALDKPENKDLRAALENLGLVKCSP